MNIKMKVAVMIECISVMFGGMLGALTRYGFVKITPAVLGFPMATFLVNVIGSFLIGLITAYILKCDTSSETLRNFAVIGFLGSFTTFSTFSLDIIKLLNSGNYCVAFIYMLLSLSVCLICTFIGLKVIL